jgi:hypothetical protein
MSEDGKWNGRAMELNCLPAAFTPSGKLQVVARGIKHGNVVLTSGGSNFAPRLLSLAWASA